MITTRDRWGTMLEAMSALPNQAPQDPVSSQRPRGDRVGNERALEQPAALTMREDNATHPSDSSDGRFPYPKSTIICPSGSRMAAAGPPPFKITTPWETKVTPPDSSRPTSASRLSTL